MRAFARGGLAPGRKRCRGGLDRPLRVGCVRPPANSYNRAFLDDLNAAIDEVRWDGDVRGAVMASELAPRFFSAGADVNNFASSTQEQRVMTVLHAQEILLKIERTPKIFVAA